MNFKTNFKCFFILVITVAVILIAFFNKNLAYAEEDDVLTSEEEASSETNENIDSTEVDSDMVSIEEATVVLAKDTYVYNGKEMTPKPTVTLDGNVLTKDIDYSVTYYNNDGFGTATVEVTGIGNYTGSISINFLIILNDIKITSINMTSKQIMITWSEVAGASKYVIYRSKKEDGTYKKIATIDGNENFTYKDKNVTIGEKYYYKVRAYYENDYTESNIKSKRVYPGQTVIKKLVVKNYNTIKIKWKQLDGVTGYYIYRSTSKNGTYKKIAIINDDTVVTYKDTGLVTGQKYFYKVCAYYDAGDTIYKGEMSKPVKGKTELSDITDIACTTSSENTILAWEMIDGASGYIIYRSESKSGKFTRINTVDSSQPLYRDTEVSEDKTYYYRVRAYRKVNGKKVFSTYSKVAENESGYSRRVVVSIAESWLGIKEYTSGHKQILKIYNSYRPRPRGYKMTVKAPWCATFVSAVSIRAGYTDIMPVECSCYMMIELLTDIGCFVEDDSYVPEPGDIIFYDWDDTTGSDADNTGDPEHVGIVEKVEGDTITVIEGNYNDASRRRKVKINGLYIRGYGVPSYTID